MAFRGSPTTWADSQQLCVAATAWVLGDRSRSYFCGGIRDGCQSFTWRSTRWTVCPVSKAFSTAYGGGRPLGGYRAVGMVDSTWLRLREYGAPASPQRLEAIFYRPAATFFAAPQGHPCDHSSWHDTNKKCNKSCRCHHVFASMGVEVALKKTVGMGGSACLNSPAREEFFMVYALLMQWNWKHTATVRHRCCLISYLGTTFCHMKGDIAQ